MDFHNKVLSYSYNTRLLLVGTGCQVVFIDVFQNFFKDLSVFFLSNSKDCIWDTFYWQKNQLEASELQDHFHSNKLIYSYWSWSKAKHSTETSLALLRAMILNATEKV